MAIDGTPKSQRIIILEKDLQFHREKVRETKNLIANTLETPPTTPLPSTSRRIDTIILSDINDSSLGPISKKREMRTFSSLALEDIYDAFHSSYGRLGAILGFGFIYGKEEHQQALKSAISEAIEIVAENKGLGSAAELAFTPDVKQKQEAAMRVPDWVQLYVKLETKLPDDGWQTVLNFLNLGKSGRDGDLQCLLTKNMIKACRSMVFFTTQSVIKISALDPECGIIGYSVGLGQAIIWAIREARLHNAAQPSMIFNIKLDGRPFAGKDQVSVGVVPVNFKHSSAESCSSVYPLAIGNCKENREELPKLIRRLNHEKNAIKESGVSVDGKDYKIKFVVTLDYKSLLLLLRSLWEGGEDGAPLRSILGGQGFDVDFCAFCTALRACKEHLSGRFDETCLTCLQLKANIGKWTGLRDDLEFLLDEEQLSHIQLCSLHQEMRNTEQLIGSLGLLSYRIGSLKSCNEAVAMYGPENTRGYDRVQVKLRTGQQTAVTKSNIHISSMSGSTERAVLANSDRIVIDSLPSEKLQKYYAEVPNSCREVVLGYVAYYESIKLYIKAILDSGTFTRDFGSKQETVRLNDTQGEHLCLVIQTLKKFLTESYDKAAEIQSDIEERFLASEQSDTRLKPPKKKKRSNSSKPKDTTCTQDALANLAAQLQLDHFRKVFLEWKVISFTIREKIFAVDEEDQIDIHDVKCKLWGFLLRHLFGVTLGMGDYAHLTVDHSAMLFQQHRSFRLFSNQGFEASHKEQRMLYSRATNHDSSAEGQSIQQILTHWYAERLLWIRYQFVQAQQCIAKGKQFSFRGCGWRNTRVSWTEEEKVWIRVIADLFVKLFREDYLKYVYSPNHGIRIEEVSDPRRSFTYDHDDWEASYEEAFNLAGGANSVSSADSLKALASQTSSADLDGISPLDPDPSPANLENPIENESRGLSSVFDKTCSDDGIVEEVAIVFSTKCTGSTAVKPQRCRQQFLGVGSQVQYGFLPSWSAPFQRITTCVLPSRESSLVDSILNHGARMSSRCGSWKGKLHSFPSLENSQAIIRGQLLV